MNIINKFRFNNDFFNEPIHIANFTIYQIGDLYCDNNTEISNHKQEVQIELSFIESGTGKFYTNGIASPVHSGQIYLSLAGDVHRIVTDNVDPLRFFYIAFNAKADTVFADIVDFLVRDFSDERRRLFTLPYIFPSMTNILSEITYKHDYFLELIECNLQQIILYFYRSSHKQLVSLSNYKIDTRKGLVYNIVNYIDTNLLEIESLEELTAKFSYDYSYMSKSFSTIMGQTIHDYFQTRKLERAKLMLAENNKTVTKIAEILNYSSIHNFSRAFKNYYGLSPKMYADSLRTAEIEQINYLNCPPNDSNNIDE